MARLDEGAKTGQRPARFANKKSNHLWKQRQVPKCLRDMAIYHANRGPCDREMVSRFAKRSTFAKSTLA